MRLLFNTIIIVLSLHAGAQGFKVRYYVPNALTNKAKTIFETSPGNYITAGFVVDSINGNYINRLTLMVLDNNGQPLWTKKYGTEKFEYLDNGLITRSFYKKNNFIYHTCCVRDSNNKYIGVLVKFNFNGDTLWQKLYKDTNSLEDVIPQMVTSTIDNGFLITGFFQNSYRKCLLIKTDINGNELWRKKIGKSNPNVQDGKAIIQDSASRKIIIVGYQYIGGTNSFENVLVLDSLGNKINQIHYNIFGGILVDLIQTKDKKFVAVGQKIFPQTLGGYNLIKSFAVKFDIDSPAVPIWMIDDFDQSSLTNNFNCLFELGNGDILIGGDLDTTHTKNLDDKYFHRLTKITKDGNVIWNRLYDYSSSPNGTYYQSLTSLSPASNGGILASFSVLNTSPNPFFFVKYDSTGCDSSHAYCATLDLVGLKEFKAKDLALKIYPNPFADILTIEIDVNENKETELILYNTLAQVVKRVIFTQNSKVDVRDLIDGVYLVTIIRNKEVVFNTKLVKN
jgi:hypothetical protein